ncbi:MAG: L-glyceraldehyde 3-phosphate reductase, partial [Bacteroidia bacterium]
LGELGTPFLIHQARYSLLDRWVENGLTGNLDDAGAGLIAFSPLAQGILSDKYLDRIPEGSRAARPSAYLTGDMVEPYRPVIRQLNKLAAGRQQSLSQMAVSWLLNKKEVTSVLVGVSSVEQLDDNREALQNIEFTSNELAEIDKILLTLSPDKKVND